MSKTIKKLATLLTILFVSIVSAPTVLAVNTSELLPDFQEYYDKKSPGLFENDAFYKNLKNYNQLPDPTFNDVVNTAIKFMLYFAGSLVVIGLLVVGVMYLSGAANEENVNKAKKILGYLGIGILIMSVAYAVVSGILQMGQFFE
ncbi:hypothetical protein HOE67_03690 [Candidatus Peregrinibacteria bacterium]|jgi:hypothetical protein|nr:hypothetical protein [Candidatus Peregrinibacteria bacterium]MBT4056188.1 hypothetical protein [Candidatus Peregrinibacteria bacterium]